METEPLLHLPISIMNVALLGKKIGMTQVFDDSNRLVPVTVIEAGPCPVTQIKSCLLYTSPSPRDATLSRMPSSA